MARPIFRRAVLAILLAATLFGAPTTADALSYDPPSWFSEAVAKLKARPGAECPGPTTATRIFTVPVYDGVPPEPSPATHREDRTVEDCLHRLPAALAKTFEVLRPSGPYGRYREGCHGEFTRMSNQTHPGLVQDQVAFRCDIFYKPVIRGRPNLRTWHCFRWRWAEHNYEPGAEQRARTGKPYWLASETKYWREQRFESLSRCLNPKYRKPK